MSIVHNKCRFFMLKFHSVFFMGMLSAFFACCSTNYIRDTKIIDTPTNREVIDRVFEFRQAFEQRDVAKLLSMASRSYYSDAGTPGNPNDDYNFEGLKAYLENNLSTIREMKYNITIKEVYPPGKKIVKGQEVSRMIVNIKYTLSFQAVTSLGERWERKTGYKQLELQKENGKWLFLTGY